MAALNERDDSKWLYNPFSVYVADVGDSQPAVPSFYTEPGVTITPISEFVEAEAYNRCSGVLYVVRKDLKRFKLNVNYMIKETTIETMKHAYGGTKNSDDSVLVFDGSQQFYAVWLETCYTDDGKIVRISIPRCKSIDFAEFGTGDEHVKIPVTLEALPQLTDTSTLPQIYFEP